MRRLLPVLLWALLLALLGSADAAATSLLSNVFGNDKVRSRREGKKGLPPSTPLVYSDELYNLIILPRTNTWVYRCEY